MKKHGSHCKEAVWYLLFFESVGDASKSTLLSLSPVLPSADEVKELVKEDELAEATPEEKDEEAEADEDENGVRRRLGAQTMERLRAVIPVSATRSLRRFK